mgnify:CR=1 FL=1
MAFNPNYNKNNNADAGAGYTRSTASGLYPIQMGTGGPGNRNTNQRRTDKKKINPLGDRRVVDYLDGKALTRYTNDLGKILPKRITGVNAFQQRQITKAIKYARHLALIPFVAQDLA